MGVALKQDEVKRIKCEKKYPGQSLFRCHMAFGMEGAGETRQPGDISLEAVEAAYQIKSVRYEGEFIFFILEKHGSIGVCLADRAVEKLFQGGGKGRQGVG